MNIDAMTYGELAAASRQLESWGVKHDALKQRMKQLEEDIKRYRESFDE